MIIINIISFLICTYYISTWILKIINVFTHMVYKSRVIEPKDPKKVWIHMEAAQGISKSDIINSEIHEIIVSIQTDDKQTTEDFYDIFMKMNEDYIFELEKLGFDVDKKIKEIKREEK